MAHFGGVFDDTFGWLCSILEAQKVSHLVSRLWLACSWDFGLFSISLLVGFVRFWKPKGVSLGVSFVALFVALCMSTAVPKLPFLVLLVVQFSL